MAIKIPVIPEMEEASELINLVSGSALYKERMTKLLEAYGQIGVGLKQYKAYQDIDSKMGEAQALVSEAKAARAIAGKLEADSKLIAETSLAEMAKRKEAMEAWHTGVRDGNEKRIKELDEREAALVEREKVVIKTTATVKFMQDEASKLIKENAELKDELEAKLGKLRQIVV